MYYVATKIRSISIHGPDLIHCKLFDHRGLVGDSSVDEASDCDRCGVLGGEGISVG